MTNPPIRLSEIDDATRDAHSRIRIGDRCLYLREKTSGRNYDFSDTNNLISNLKKPVTSSPAVKQYKERAIIQCAAEFRGSLNPEWLDEATLVPVPPSKDVADPAYDDRMERICRLIRQGQDVRNLVVQTGSMVANHARGAGARVTVEELSSAYSIAEELTNPAPKQIGVVDDMLTTGTHFRAMHEVLSKRFPGVPIIGLFVARRIFPD